MADTEGDWKSEGHAAAVCFEPDLWRLSSQAGYTATMGMHSEVLVSAR